MDGIKGNILMLGNHLRGRIDDSKIDDALEYIDFNEVPLSFNILCDHIADDGVPLKRYEMEEILKISKCSGMALPEKLITYLNSLID